MGKKIIIKGADFSANGIYNPTIDWIIDYAWDEQTRGSFCAPYDGTPRMSVLFFVKSKGKRVRYIWLRVNTSDSNFHYVSKISAYKISYNSSERSTTGIKIRTYDYTITSSGPDSTMVIDLGENVDFVDSYLGLLTFNYTPEDVLRSVVCGMGNKSDLFDYVSYVTDPVFDSDGNFTAGTITENIGFRGYCPDAKLGID